MAVKYDLVEAPDGFHADHWAVKVLEGSCEGLTFQYDTITFNEREDGQAVLDYNTITIDNPTDVDLTSEEAIGIMGDVLVDIIEQQLRESVDNAGKTDTEALAE
jgi:hypothetical protein|tara:strand:- start:448 stop:759 length:312 start_codon:yes stop_codon:yes gene_type:complete